ncbi:MAG: bifunctional methylenetetrahydrofolate dehydrogenase/methenyltetrahydrofolate cyclohydrolase FolD [Planctomycetaceae bacterium]|nr:bifunctional methylenetetrahydrofolate dehydrogenase/methenyltetrahydrofolate cyclohydrolase FolD [Planctomycetaceae bacterium]
MTAMLLDGKAVAASIRSEIADATSEFIATRGVTPKLAAVLVGENPASQVYVRNKQRACDAAGIGSDLHRLTADCGESELLRLVTTLNHDPSVHGILVQLPLPDSIQSQRILQAIDPNKDVDAFHPENVGRLVQGKPRFVPCTPQGIQQLLIRQKIETSGRRVVVIGRSDIVGKPIACMLGNRGVGGDATVTLCHSRTINLNAIARQAEILIVAIGRPQFVGADMVKPGAVVIDVGIHRTDEGLVGDVDFDAVAPLASAITPVPGGVGPLTVAMLLQNTLRAAQLANSE